MPSLPSPEPARPSASCSADRSALRSAGRSAVSPAHCCFPPKGQDSQGPRLSDLTVQSSGYGLSIPMAVGRVKLAGNVIWKTELRERATTRRQGKGGGGARSTTYSYYLSWAVGLCEWLIPPASPQVLRIWLDTHLVYDTTGASEVTQIPAWSGASIRAAKPSCRTRCSPVPSVPARRRRTGPGVHRLRGGAARTLRQPHAERHRGTRRRRGAQLPAGRHHPAGCPLWPSSPSGRTYLGSWPATSRSITGVGASTRAASAPPPRAVAPTR